MCSTRCSGRPRPCVSGVGLVWGSGFRVLGFKVGGLGFFGISGLGFRVSEFGVEGLGPGFRLTLSGLRRCEGFWFRISGPGVSASRLSAYNVPPLDSESSCLSRERHLCWVDASNPAEANQIGLNLMLLNQQYVLCHPINYKPQNKAHA